MNQEAYLHKKSAAILAVAASLASLLALAVWQLNIRFFQPSVPGITAMNHITATYIIFASAAIWLLLKKGNHRSIRESVKMVSLLIAITGVIDIIRALTHSHVPGGNATDLLSKRMNPGAAMGMILTGASLFLTACKSSKCRQAANYLMFVLLVAGTYSIIGNLFQLVSLFTLQGQFTFSVAAALCFVLISFSLLFYNHGTRPWRALINVPNTEM